MRLGKVGVGMCTQISRQGARLLYCTVQCSTAACATCTRGAKTAERVLRGLHAVAVTRHNRLGRARHRHASSSHSRRLLPVCATTTCGATRHAAHGARPLCARAVSAVPRTARLRRLAPVPALGSAGLRLATGRAARRCGRPGWSGEKNMSDHVAASRRRRGLSACTRRRSRSVQCRIRRSQAVRREGIDTVQHFLEGRVRRQCSAGRTDHGAVALCCTPHSAAVRARAEQEIEARVTRDVVTDGSVHCAL